MAVMLQRVVLCLRELRGMLQSRPEKGEAMILGMV